MIEEGRSPMSTTKIKKVLKLGNSYAIILPREFVKKGEEMIMEYDNNELRITHKIPQETIVKERELFGQYGSGKKDLAKNRKKYLAKYLDEKYRHH